MKRWMRMCLARLFLRLGVVATAIRLHYLGWLFYRWSLILAPVADEARRNAVHWWDMNGYLWGFCRWPKSLDSAGEP